MFALYLAVDYCIVIHSTFVLYVTNLTYYFINHVILDLIDCTGLLCFGQNPKILTLYWILAFWSVQDKENGNVVASEAKQSHGIYIDEIASSMRSSQRRYFQTDCFTGMRNIVKYSSFQPKPNVTLHP